MARSRSAAARPTGRKPAPSTNRPARAKRGAPAARRGDDRAERRARKGESSRQAKGTARRPRPPFPEQHQPKPGIESKMTPRTRYMAPDYKAAGKLEGRAALITGGDSGIGRAVAVLYAREGADVAITYLPAERGDAEETRDAVEAEGRRCLLLEGDLTDAAFCEECVERTVGELGHIDILVSNAAWQNRKEDIEDVTDEEWDRTFKTNVYAYYRLAKAAIPHMKRGSAIIATSSETAFKGPERLPDYAATKGAINTLTMSLAKQLIGRGIRVNAVAAGPVWTPLNIADQGTPAKKVAKFGEKQPIGRPAQPEELAPAYVFLASEADSSYIAGEVIRVLGGETLGDWPPPDVRSPMSQDLLDTRLYAMVGEEGFARLVAAFYRRVETDDILGPMYRESAERTGETLADAEARLRDFLVYRFGGPARYIERRGHPRLRARHTPFSIDRAAADRWVALMDESMAETAVPADAAAAMRPFFAHVAGFMINRG